MNWSKIKKDLRDEERMQGSKRLERKRESEDKKKGKASAGGV